MGSLFEHLFGGMFGGGGGPTPSARAKRGKDKLLPLKYTVGAFIIYSAVLRAIGFEFSLLPL